MPDTAAYKRYTMATVNQRLTIVQNVIKLINSKS